MGFAMWVVIAARIVVQGGSRDFRLAHVSPRMVWLGQWPRHAAERDPAADDDRRRAPAVTTHLAHARDEDEWL
jgi:hypothetical protein